MTIMARTRSLSSIETEISKVTAELQKAQEKVDELTQRLLELQEQKQSIEVKQIMDAFRRSGKSMQELLTGYSCAGVPLFRRNGYRQSSGRKPLFRNRDTALN